MSGCTSGLHAAEPKTGKMYRTEEGSWLTSGEHRLGRTETGTRLSASDSLASASLAQSQLAGGDERLEWPLASRGRARRAHESRARVFTLSAHVAPAWRAVGTRSMLTEKGMNHFKICGLRDT